MNKNIGFSYFLSCSVLSLALFAQPLSAQEVSFDEAIAKSQSATPAIEARSLAIEAAQSAAIAADQLPDPKISVDFLDQRLAAHRESLRPGRDGFLRQMIGVSQEIPNGAKRSARAEKAQAEILAAEANKSQMIYTANLNTAIAWVNLYYAHKRLKILDMLESSIRDLSSTVNARLISGGSRPAQAYEPELLLAQLADRRAMRLADMDIAAAELTRWTGITHPEIIGNPPDITLDRDALIARIDQLPAFAIREAMVQRAEANLDLARADKRPDVTVNAAFTHRRPEYGEYLSVGVTVDLPLFTAKRQNPVIDARILEANAARLEVEELRRQLNADLSSDLASNRAYRENWLRAKNTLLPLAKKQAELEKISYGAGRTDLATALGATIAFAEAEIDLLDREATLVRDTIRIQFTYAGDAE